MWTTLAGKGQVTIAKQIRDAPNFAPGCAVDFAVNREGNVVIHKAGARPRRKPDRFESARAKANVKWRTDDRMALLRGEGRCYWPTPTCWSTFWSRLFMI